MVSAFAAGAGQCPGGIAAVGASHLQSSKTVTNGELSESPAGLQVTLNGTPLESSVTTPFVMGQDHTIALTATTMDATFKGFLLRLGTNGEEENGGANMDSNSTATTTIMTTDALQVVADDDTNNVKVAQTVCVMNEQVGGLTHTNNVPKTTIQGILRMDEVMADNNLLVLPLDVTVVIRNQGSDSEFYYSQYLLQAVESDYMINEQDSSSTAATNDDESGSLSRQRHCYWATTIVILLTSLSLSQLILLG